VGAIKGGQRSEKSDGRVRDKGEKGEEKGEKRP